MTPDDAVVQGLLQRAMVARLATESASGRPQLNPNYFVLHQGHIWLGTSNTTLAARNVVANPRVSLLFDVESEAPGRPVLRVTGTAQLSFEPTLISAYRALDTRKYFLSRAGLRNLFANVARWRLLRAYLRNPGAKSCVIDVTPEKVEFLYGRTPGAI